MIVSFNDEVWKDFSFPENNPLEYFKISNYGRVVRVKHGQEDKDDKLYQSRPVNGYEVINLKLPNGKKTTRYLHKLVAELFIENSENKRFVTHLDFNKKNNHVENLQWMTHGELGKHHDNNPKVIEGKAKRKKNIPYSKLSEAKVKLIKRKIFDPNRRTRLKMIAKQFGISEMQLWRIKSGENWGHVTDY
ncbi:HNH endonuclease [Mangrovimonas spongiae]|uniref:HNH endonuclease n=1 Tax=Mangrovimonas spongiae TaxID=2494697 RepID=A0A428K4J0_9FLAO|nr:HNH endonuclease [Mangrovimonas spongiae]RSK41354.1 HNH endonuclease [Mangrovimonas spongiae]